MNLERAENLSILEHLSRAGRDAPAYATRDAAADPYYRCGCHPEIVERIWDQIGVVLPADCRCLVHGTPALVHPTSGVILAMGMGTQYGLRLPGGLGAEAIQAGAHIVTRWSGGTETRIREHYGEDWVFGAWLSGEPGWCQSAYGLFSTK